MKSIKSVLDCRRPQFLGLIAILLASLTLAPFASGPRAQAFVGVGAIADDDNTVRPSDSAVTEYPIPTPNSGSSNITVGPDGTFWFTETNANKISQVTTNGFFKEFPLPTANSQPFGIVLGADLAMWFTEQGSNKIGKMTADGSITEFSIPTANSGPYGIARGGDGALWFVENVTNKIGRITTGGSITEFGIPTTNSGPLFITTGPDGNLWFTERTAGKVGRITPGGSFTEFAIPTPGSGPEGITSAFDGNIWFTEKHVDKIGIATTSGNITELQLFAGSDPARITAVTDGSVYVTEQAPNKFLQITPSALLASIAPAEVFRDFPAGPPGGGAAGIGFVEAKVEGGDLSTGSAAALETQLNAVSIARSEFTGGVELTKTGSPEPVDGGHPVTYSITVKNKSIQPLTYDLIDVGPSGLVVLPTNPSVTNPGWIDYFAGAKFGNEHLNPGEVRQYSIQFDTTTAGGTGQNKLELISLPAHTVRLAGFTSHIHATPDPDFLLEEPNPLSQLIGAAQKTGYSITTQLPHNQQARGITSDAAPSVTFNAVISPASDSIMTSFSPNPLFAPGSTTLNVSTTPSTPLGTYSVLITATAGPVIHTTGVTLVVSATQTSDFSLAFDSPTVTAQAGTKARVTVNIVRTGGFTGNVTITPPPPANGIKAKPPDPIPTTDASVVFKFKVGGGVTPGQYPLTFTAKDDSGRARTGTVTLIVQ